MITTDGDPIFCNTCPDRGTCVGPLTTEIKTTPERFGKNERYDTLQLQDRVRGRSSTLNPLEGSWFNHMIGRREHVDAAGEILLDRVAACTGPDATGQCVIVDIVGISEAVIKQFPMVRASTTG